MVDVRLILDATDYGYLPASDEWDADYRGRRPKRLGLLRLKMARSMWKSPTQEYHED